MEFNLGKEGQGSEIGGNVIELIDLGPAEIEGLQSWVTRGSGFERCEGMIKERIA